MDYSKKTEGGTRVLDPIVARTLATGIGQSVAAARGKARLAPIASPQASGRGRSSPTKPWPTSRVARWLLTAAWPT